MVWWCDGVVVWWCGGVMTDGVMVIDNVLFSYCVLRTTPSVRVITLQGARDVFILFQSLELT